MSNPKALVNEVLKLPFKSLFWKGIRYRNLRKAFVLFAVVLALQLRYSRRARGYATKAVMVLGFGASFAGFLITSMLFVIKMKMHNKHKAQVEEMKRQASF